MLYNKPIKMKSFFLLLLIVPTLSYSQDSAHTVVNNVIVKARDLAFYRLYMEKGNKTEDLDSVIKSKYRSLDPADNADITVNGIQRRVWRDMLNVLYSNVQALQSNRYKRVHDAILLINDPWLNDKITRDEAAAKDIDDTLITAAKKDAKKQND
jgi:hypothetical protein